jgi:hypothetical protein
MKNSLLLVTIVVLFTQCGSINGFYSGYKKLSAVQKNQIIKVNNSSSCDIKNNDKIHMISTEQLRSCLKRNEKSLIYQWSPNCHSDVCILISACQDYCNQNGLELYVIAEYYDWDKMQGQNVAKRPIFTLEHNYYKTDYVLKYNRLFLQDLAPNNPLVGKKEYGRFLFFKKDMLVERRNRLF